MRYRALGRSGLRVSELSFGAATFGGQGEFFSAWGNSGVAEATRLIRLCIDAGVNLFDTADIYSGGESERILGAALGGERDNVLIATKIGQSFGDGPNRFGASRIRLIRGVEQALRRLGTDRIDVFQLHGADSTTPIEETWSALDSLVTAGKVRYVGVSNYAGWQLQTVVDTTWGRGWVTPISHQVHYSLICRDYEWELMPLGEQAGLGAMVWSPLGWGRLTGKLRRGTPPPIQGRLAATAEWAPPVDDDLLFNVLDELQRVAEETGLSIPVVALTWLLQRPTVSTVIIGARTEQQLAANLQAGNMRLDDEHIERLDAASYVTPPYPHFLYHRNPYFAELSPPTVPPPAAPLSDIL